MSAKEYINVGAVKLSKDKKKEYINFNLNKNQNGEYTTDNLVKLHKALTAYIKDPGKNGLSLFMSDPKAKFDFLVKKGEMTEERAEEIKAKIPDYIKKEITLIIDAD